MEERLAALGHTFDWKVEHRWSNDGDDHPDAAASRDAYEAFRRPSRVAMLRDMGVPEETLDEAYGVMFSPVPKIVYPDVPPVLAALRASGVRMAVCSNWDWDLDVVLAACHLDGFFDVAITSARVGCRKPHRRIFEHTLAELGVDVEDAAYVGDTPHADVEGPLAIGLRPVHVWRWSDTPPPVPDGVTTIPDLRPLADLL